MPSRKPPFEIHRFDFNTNHDLCLREPLEVCLTGIQPDRPRTLGPIRIQPLGQRSSRYDSIMSAPEIQYLLSEIASAPQLQMVIPHAGKPAIQRICDHFDQVVPNDLPSRMPERTEGNPCAQTVGSSGKVL
jgi:hypothetical protein